MNWLALILKLLPDILAIIGKIEARSPGATQVIGQAISDHMQQNDTLKAAVAKAEL